MKAILGVCNLIAAFGITLLIIQLISIDSTTAMDNEAVIGGTDGPTAIFFSSGHCTPGLILTILLVGLLYANAYILWRKH